MTLWFGANWVYQAVRKPAELFFPVGSALDKAPAETWRQYEPIFREHSTAVIAPELLAALAQLEGAGNPVARTYWRWRLTHEPFEVYRPASSAVGMYQINSLYLRVVPSHAVEMTSAYLDRRVAGILERLRLGGATLQQKQDLAAGIHLCGAAAGESYVRRGFQPADKQRCGDHDLRGYLARVNATSRVFRSLAARPPG